MSDQPPAGATPDEPVDPVEPIEPVDPPRGEPAGDAPRDELTHLDARGHARMVDVADKEITSRVAEASARVLMTPETAAKLRAGDLPKGDALPVARIAGIQAAKRTPELIPLCHHIALSSVTVDIEVDTATGVVEVAATAKATDRTGVEMEALTAATIASLTLYDLVKAVQRDVVITDVRLTAKSGGRSGDYRAV